MISVPLLASVCAALVLGGLLLIVDGSVRRPAAPPKPPKRRRARRLRLTGPQKIAGLVAAVAGLVVAVTTGWILAVILLPVAALLLPTLLSAGGTSKTIKRLEAIEDWSRHMAGRLGVGRMLEDAIMNSMATVKPAIEPEVRKLVARLRAQWPLEKALDAFGDDLDDAVGDQLVASLKMAANRNNAAGLQAVLADVADSVAISVSHRRMVDSEQSKVRQTVRLVTAISLVVLGLSAVTGWMAPYNSPLGHAILALLSAAYLGCLIWIRRSSEPPAPPRILAARREAA